jgi:hypothetical protein
MRVICKFGAICSAHPPVYAICTVVPAMNNAITAPNIQASIFNWIYLRCYWTYADICMRVIMQIWYNIQRTASSLRNVNCGPGHIQCIYSSIYSGFNIQLNVSAVLWGKYRQFNVRYTPNVVPNTAHILQFTLSELWFRTCTMYL